MRRGRGGVEYEDLVEGSGATAARGLTVTVRYTMRLHHGEVVQEGTVTTFQVGARQVIAGLNYGVEGMRMGGRRRFRIGPHLAYGDHGVAGKIPPSALLDVDVTLLEVQVGPDR